MNLDLFIAYTGIVFFATIIPGPSMLLAINHGATHGVGKTVYSGLGNLIGNLLMALASLLGLGIILLASGFIFNVIKWLGAGYLVFIGIKMIAAPIEEDNNYVNIKHGRQRKRCYLFIDGFLIAIGNPKGIIFFTALFPQFINTHNATLSSFIIVFSTLAIIAFGCYMFYAVFGVKLNRLFQKRSFRKIFNRVSGSMMVGIGVSLAFAKRHGES